MPNQKKDTPMQITVRLYRQHDMDLVGLYRTKDFKFQRHMKNALKAYAEGKDYRINHPGDEDIRKGYVPKIVQMRTNLYGKCIVKATSNGEGYNLAVRLMGYSN